MSIEDIERGYEASRRQLRMNRTWKNPRYYTIFPLLPFALVLSVVPICLLWIGRWSSWLGEHADEGLRSLWSPYNCWIEKGKTP